MEIKIWKSICLAVGVVLVVIATLFYVKNKQVDVLSVMDSDITYLSVPGGEAVPIRCSGKFETDKVSDGENVYGISILRIDDLLVDDQYYAYLWPEDQVTGLGVEISNDVKIIVFQNFKSSNGRKITVDLETFRKLVSGVHKDNIAHRFFYKVKIKNSLIENIEQIIK
jgi:hypothetical protein